MGGMRLASWRRVCWSWILRYRRGKWVAELMSEAGRHGHVVLKHASLEERRVENADTETTH
jgi:hypothetical protein